MLDTSFRENPAILLSPESTFASKQRKVWISIGTLPLLGIGDIWRNGQLEMRPDYELEHFLDLDINSETAVLIKAGLNLEERGFLLPLAEHPWHRQCTQSYCLMVELPNNRRLIIPCMELIRFYFGSSSNLLTKLFLPPLSRDALYSKPQFNKATGRLTLQLATGISGMSAADIGRLHMDPAAWRAAAHIGASLLKASVSGQGVYPQAYFPFEGRTNLIASGKWLSVNEQGMHVAPTPSQIAAQRFAHIPPKGDKRNIMQSAPHLCPPSWAKMGMQAVDVWGRMDYDKPANTIRCAFQNASKGRYIHPVANRVISLREGARLQGVPDHWIFHGDRSSIARQIGNGVPIPLAAAVAESVSKLFT